MNLPKIMSMARQRYRAVRKQHKIEGVIIPINCYLSEHDYEEVTGEDEELSWPEHTAMIAVFSDIVARRGGVPVLVPIFAEAFFAWLKKNKLKNTPEIRAKYGTEVAVGETRKR